jgi:hypothetical protein
MRSHAIWPEFVIVVGALALVAGCGGSRTSLPDDAGEKPAEEEVAALPAPPAYPLPEQLIRVNLGPSSFEYFIDAGSLAVEPGGIRYTLVARSAQGATNTSFEGMRCRTGERRLYALGRSDGTWAPPRKSEWVPVNSGVAARPHVTLADHYFCPGREAVTSVDEALRALRFGGHTERSPEALMYR